MPINKFTTLLDLSRQAKIITGETATFDGKILSGIPFSGYPTGVDISSVVSLGVVSGQDAIFSGNTGTTVFDISNPLSPNYSPTYSGYTAFTWSNPLFSGNTTGLTLPITILSADTQVVGPFWTLTQTGYTGDYIIGTQYTGYSITYSFFNVSSLNIASTLFSGVTTASQENFSAGTLDYKGPLDYISSKEDVSVENRLITNKITISNGATSATTNYVLSQIDSTGKGAWSSISSLLSGSCLPIVNLDVVNDCFSGITFNSDVTINGDVVVNGSATTINTQIIQSKDNNIILNYSGTHLTAIGGGITLEDGQSNGVDSRIYTDSNGTWLFDPGLSANSGTILSFSANSINVNNIGTSANCVNDIYVSNIHGCSTITFQDKVQSVNSSATGVTSFAFGFNANAYGDYSTASGYYSTASGIVSHAEGIYTIASGIGAHAEGYSGKGNIIASGQGSHAEGGALTTASGNYSHAEGLQTNSIGTGSHSEGSGTIASGTSSHSEGRNTTASGNYSHAEGEDTDAFGPKSHSEGESTAAYGDGSHSEGLQTSAIGDYSHSEGFNTSATTLYSHSEGYESLASGNGSHAEGRNTIASGNYSHAEGYSGKGNIIASGIGSHAEGGSLTTATGDYSHAEGLASLTIGEGSHAEGSTTTAQGFYSHSEGTATYAHGLGSHSEGNATLSYGAYSHAEGINTIANGLGSHAEGLETVADGDNQHVSGKWNVTGDTTVGAFIVGNGINSSNRSNLIFAGGNIVNISGKTITTNFQMTSGGTNNYVLTSDAYGNASWQNISGVFTGNTSANCITDLYVSNIHSCSPLSINPNDEGDVYFGSSNNVIVDLTNKKLILTGTTLNQSRLEAYTLGTGAVDNLINLSLYNSSTLNRSNRINFDRYWGTPGAIQVISGATTCMDLRARGFAGIIQQDLTSIQMGGSISGGTFEGNIKFFTRDGGIFSSLQERIRLTADGNLGIGTTTPEELLHVDGNARIDGVYSGVNPNLSIGQNEEIQFLNSSSSIPRNIDLVSAGNLSRLRLNNGSTSPSLRTDLVQFGSYSELGANFSTGATSSPLYIVNYSDNLIIFRVNAIVDTLYLLETGSTLSVFSATSKPVVFVKDFLEAENIALRAVGTTAFVNDIRIDANGKFTTNTSDERLKENISPLNNSLNTVLQLSGVTYQWKDRNSGGDDIRFGFIAQQVERVEPKLVFTNKNDGYKGLNSDCFIPLMVESIKELYNNPSIPNYTPFGSGDTYGNIGNISVDEDYLYVKTNNGWKRTSLESF